MSSAKWGPFFLDLNVLRIQVKLTTTEHDMIGTMGKIFMMYSGDPL